MSENLTGRIIKQISGYYDIAVNGTTTELAGAAVCATTKLRRWWATLLLFNREKGMMKAIC